MGEDVSLAEIHNAITKAGRQLGLDPRLVALVQFLAQRAAEADHGDVEEAETTTENPHENERSDD